MDDQTLWVLRRNIARFENLLTLEKNEQQRRVIAEVLEGAKRRVVEIESRSPPTA